MKKFISTRPCYSSSSRFQFFFELLSRQKLDCVHPVVPRSIYIYRNVIGEKAFLGHGIRRAGSLPDRSRRPASALQPGRRAQSHRSA